MATPLASGVSAGVGVAAVGVGGGASGSEEWVRIGGEAMLDAPISGRLGAMECVGVWGAIAGRVSDVGVVPGASQPRSLVAGESPLVAEHPVAGVTGGLVGRSRISGGLAGDQRKLGEKRGGDSPLLERGGWNRPNLGS